MKKSLQRFLETLDTQPPDVLIAAHPYGILCVAHSHRFSMREALMEIRRSTPRTVACYPVIHSDEFLNPFETVPEVLICWDSAKPPPPELVNMSGLCVIRHVPFKDFAKGMLIFSGHLTSPWTLFSVPEHMGAKGALPARKTLVEMARNVHALKHSDPQVLRQRLRAVETSVKSWFTPPTPKHPSGFRLGLFPQEAGVDRSKLLLGPDSVHIMTKPDEADLITRLVVQKCRSGRSVDTLTITDATANVGGNTLSFSRVFKKVNSIEIDPVNFQALIHNIQSYKRENVECIFGNCLDLLCRTQQHVVFIDPPWGGMGYRMHRHIQLTLSGRSLGEIVSKIVNFTELVVVKAPLNFDMAMFLKQIAPLLENSIARVEALTMRSFLILFVHFM